MAGLGDVTYTVLLPAVTARVTTTNTTGSDVAAYADNGLHQMYAVLNVGTITGTQGTLDVTIEECTTTNGTFTTIGTFAQVTTTTGSQKIGFKTSKQYVRATGTTGGTTPSAVYEVLIYGRALIT